MLVVYCRSGASVNAGAESCGRYLSAASSARLTAAAAGRRPVDAVMA